MKIETKFDIGDLISFNYPIMEMEKCEVCEGRSFVYVPGGWGWDTCPKCKGKTTFKKIGSSVRHGKIKGAFVGDDSTKISYFVESDNPKEDGPYMTTLEEDIIGKE